MQYFLDVVHDLIALDQKTNNHTNNDEMDDEEEYDGQPDEYTEWQDYMGGDDWDHGQFDE